MLRCHLYDRAADGSHFRIECGIKPSIHNTGVQKGLLLARLLYLVATQLNAMFCAVAQHVAASLLSLERAVSQRRRQPDGGKGALPARAGPQGFSQLRHWTACAPRRATSASNCLCLGGSFLTRRRPSRQRAVVRRHHFTREMCLDNRGVQSLSRASSALGPKGRKLRLWRSSWELCPICQLSQSVFWASAYPGH